MRSKRLRAVCGKELNEAFARCAARVVDKFPLQWPHVQHSLKTVFLTLRDPRAMPVDLSFTEAAPLPSSPPLSGDGAGIRSSENSVDMKKTAAFAFCNTSHFILHEALFGRNVQWREIFLPIKPIFAGKLLSGKKT